TKPGMLSRSTDFLRHGPDVSTAAKSGSPTMQPPKPQVPVSVPAPAATNTFSGDVTVAPVTDPTALDTKPDARPNPPAPAKDEAPKADAASSSSTPADSQQPQTDSKKKNDKKKKKTTQPDK